MNSEERHRMLLSCVLGIALASAPACTKAEGGSATKAPDASSAAATAGGEISPSASADVLPPRAPLSAEDRQFYADVGHQAWKYMQENYEPATGFVRATPDWANTTLWDVGAQLLATHSAKEMQIIPPEEYDKRTKTLLNTLEKLELWRGVYNKLYSAKDGSISKEGRSGWSATDLGRFLLALKIISIREPQFAAQITRIVRRADYKEVLKNGYMYGQLVGTNGKPWSFQEGRIGYEQYSGEGFRQWGLDARNAVNVRKNAKDVKVLGVPIYGDKRYNDRLLSEPFILYGVEVGLSGDYLKLASNMLLAQEARFKSTGKITIASEDAVNVAPHYFYYYCVYCNGKPFIVDLAETGKFLDSPRWVSTKGAFGWHAVLPSDYTRKALDFVKAGAVDPKRGWASGVYEDTGKSTRTFDINTAAVLLEIVNFQLRGGKPLIL